jgi:hypothetical protein
VRNACALLPQTIAGKGYSHSRKFPPHPNMAQNKKMKDLRDFQA